MAPETVAQLLGAAFERCNEYMASGSEGNREFALAKTAIEDAQMRFTRGLAQRKGVFSPADLEAPDGA